MITRCGVCSYFPAFPFSTQAQCSSHRAWCEPWDVALCPSCTQLTPASSALTGLEGNLWCLVLAAFTKSSACISYCVSFVLQGIWDRCLLLPGEGRNWTSTSARESPSMAPFPSTHPLSCLFQFHTAPLVHECRAVKCSPGPTTTSPLGWCLTHLSAPSPLTGISEPTCASLLREHLYIYKTVTHISHVHQHEGSSCWLSHHRAHAHPAQGLLLWLARRGHILHAPLAAGDLGVRLAGMAVAHSWDNMWHPSGDPPACRLAYGNPTGTRPGVPRRIPWGAPVWLACWEARCVSPPRRGHGTPRSWVLAPTGNMLTRGCILQGSCWTMHTQSQGC